MRNASKKGRQGYSGSLEFSVSFTLHMPYSLNKQIPDMGSGKPIDMRGKKGSGILTKGYRLR
jgi:hypothetical protein